MLLKRLERPFMETDKFVFIHPKGICESETVGNGTKIWAFAHVMKGASIGENCNICGGVFVEQGANIGDNVTIKNGVCIWDRVTIRNDVFIGPGTIFTNDLIPRNNNRTSTENFLPTLVEEGASIGANATIKCGVVIGKSAFIGAGSVVTRSILDFEMVVGNPAKFYSWICYCGNQIIPETRCTCGRTYSLNKERLVLKKGELL
jgi:acetyltransferase-like isoleucine patch superfamily enzyme